VKRLAKKLEKFQKTAKPKVVNNNEENLSKYGQ
jgi:hypothetical protein